MEKELKKLLFIGHAFHNKTKSSDFILNLFEKEYDIEKFSFDPYENDERCFEKLKGYQCDMLVLWQIMPSLTLLKKYIKWKHAVFFPMYDGIPPLNEFIWDEYRNCNIINFCKVLHEDLKRRGFSSYYIQYFPKPAEIKNWGDEKSVFLWERRENINSNTVDEVLGVDNVNKLYLHQVPDPEQNIIQPDEKWLNKVKISKWFDTKEQMNDYSQECAIYFAPRLLEGIGMSFLGAMALGRCVIAPNNPTMNEYIQHGKTGYLYNPETPEKIEISDIRKIQQTCYEYIKNGCIEWENNKIDILKWIEAPVIINRWSLFRFYGYRMLRDMFFSIKKDKSRKTFTIKIITILGLKIKYRKKRNN